MHIHHKISPSAYPCITAGILALGLSATSDARRSVGQPATDIAPTADAPLAQASLFQLETATIQDIQSAMNEGSLTSVELVSLYLRRIQAYNNASTISPVQPLNAILSLNPDLLEDAAQADRLRKQGIILGPLHGIPFLVKGSIPIKGMALSGGTNAWANLISNGEAWSVEKIRAVGGIVMGHANMDTWASSATTSSSQIRGAVRSAFLQGAYPGGSSGGSGVSAGAYLTHFTFGGETGGSIRNPGDRNGLVAYKVSGGSISVNKIIPLVAERDVIGPMTRAAVDNAIIRDVVGKKDPNDPWAPILPVLEDKRKVPENTFVSKVQGATLRGKKIGIIGTYVGLPHPNPGTNPTTNTTAVQTTTPATFALVEQAKADMQAAGATVEYVFMPPAVSTTYPLGETAPQTRFLQAPYSDQVNAYILRSVVEAAVSRPDYTYSQNAALVMQAATAQSQISATRRNMFYTINAQTGAYSPGPTISFGSVAGYEHYLARGIQKNAFETWMNEQGLDAVVWPVWPNKGRTTGTIIGRDLVNFMHLPAVTVPMGRLDVAATSTLPAGQEPLTLNVTGRLYDDDNVLAIAYAYEQATKHRYSPTLAPPLSGEVFDYKRQSKKPFSLDIKQPVLTYAPSVTYGRGGMITFSGTVADAGGIDRLEVSVAGTLIPATVEGNKWSAVLPAGSTTMLYLAETQAIGVVVLAVDQAGNATTTTGEVTL